MGCFDVSCGISGMSIHSGDKAKLLLLIPKNSHPHYLDLIKSNVELEPQTNLVSCEGPMALYQPFCLPITGKYNDYGSLENIVKDATVKSLEKYFELPIEQILEIIGSSRSIWDSYAGILSAYGTELEIGYSDKTTDDWLKKAGFTLNDDGNWYHKDIKNVTKWNKENNKWEDTGKPYVYITFKVMENVTSSDPNYKKVEEYVVVYWDTRTDSYSETWGKEQKRLCESVYENSGTQTFYKNETGIMIGIKPEFKKRVELLRKLSGMFVDGKLYDNMSSSNENRLFNAYIDKYIMKYIGFKFEYFTDENYNLIKYDENLINLKRDEKQRQLIFSYDGIDNYRFSVDDRNDSMCATILSYTNGKINKLKGKYDGDCFNAIKLQEKIKEIIEYNIDISALNNINAMENTFDSIKEYYKKTDIVDNFIEEEKNKPEKNADKLMEQYFWKTNNKENRNDIFGYLNLFPLTDELYKKELLDSNIKLKNDISNFYAFMSILWNINKIFIPSSHFSQHGDCKEQLSFNKMVQKVLKSKVKKDNYE